jgi:hypothetical protein
VALLGDTGAQVTHEPEELLLRGRTRLRRTLLELKVALPELKFTLLGWKFALQVRLALGLGLRSSGRGLGDGRRAQQYPRQYGRDRGRYTMPRDPIPGHLLVLRLY